MNGVKKNMRNLSIGKCEKKNTTMRWLNKVFRSDQDSRRIVVPMMMMMTMMVMTVFKSAIFTFLHFLLKPRS